MAKITFVVEQPKTSIHVMETDNYLALDFNDLVIDLLGASTGTVLIVVEDKDIGAVLQRIEVTQGETPGDLNLIFESINGKGKPEKVMTIYHARECLLYSTASNEVGREVKRADLRLKVLGQLITDFQDHYVVRLVDRYGLTSEPFILPRQMVL